MDEQTNNPVQGEQVSTPENMEATETQQTEQKTEQTFTQAQVSGIAAKESKAAIEKLLSDLGFEGEGSAKERVAAFKQWQDSQKTEVQRAAEALEAAQKDLQQERETNANLQAQILALGKQIPADKVPHYINLAKGYMGEDNDLSTALDAAIADFPFKTNAPTFTAPANGGGALSEDEFAQRINKYKK